MIYSQGMKTSSLYRLEIAPVVVLPLSKTTLFSYISDVPIAKGSIVRIPFGRRVLDGVVYDCKILPGKAPLWMKYIKNVLIESFLTEEQLALAQYISAEYCTPLGKTLTHFLPKQVRARKYPAEPTEHILPLRPRAAEQAILKSFRPKQKNTTVFLDTKRFESERFFPLIAHKTAVKKQQTLILVPELTLLPAVKDAFLKYFEKHHVAILHSGLSNGAYLQAWEQIRSGKARVILATRQGLFAPFQNLGTIILSEEQDDSYKQWDRSPRYHGKRVAFMLATLHTATLVLASKTPSTESISGIETQSIRPLAPLLTTLPLTTLSLVNLRLERFHKNYSPLSKTLIDAIREALTQKQQVLLYVHRQGMNLFSVCEQCKTVLRCPAGHAMIWSKEGFFRCLSCSHKTGIFPACSNCGHLSFKNIGFGTEKIEKEVLRAFPHARVSRADGSTLRTFKAAHALYDKGMSGKIDILIGTQMILKNPPLPKLSVLAMIDADSLLFFPDFRADERLFQHLSRATSNTRVIVQTFHPESAFFQKISSLESSVFYQNILAERESLLYPPFGRLISVLCRKKTREDAETSVTKVVETLKQSLPQGITSRITPPQTKKFVDARGFYESSILIRLPETKTLPETVRKALSTIRTDCIIDVDPLST